MTRGVLLANQNTDSLMMGLPVLQLGYLVVYDTI